jgi:predicted type IV restriction endonuclease
LDTTETDALQEKIDAIHLLLTKALSSGMKINEAQTEMWVINPLLEALGYNMLEIHKQSHDANTNQFPDYTLLPHESCRWFLEVKGLDVPLQDKEAAQAVNYAANKGADWAVLTNGRKWLFYKAHLPKPLPEKLVFQIQDLFGEPQAANTLQLLSRASVTANGLTEAWLTRQVNKIVERELKTAYSATRKTLRKVAATETQAAVTDAAISDALTRLMEELGAGQQGEAETASAQDTDALRSLTYWNQNLTLVIGRKPTQLKLGSDVSVSVKSWSVVAQSVVKFVGEKYGLPQLPFTGSLKGKKYFIHTTNIQATGKPMITMVSVGVSGKTIYLDMNRSADNTISCLAALLAAVNIPLDAVRIEVGMQKMQS